MALRSGGLGESVPFGSSPPRFNSGIPGNRGASNSIRKSNSPSSPVRSTTVALRSDARRSTSNEIGWPLTLNVITPPPAKLIIDLVVPHRGVMSGGPEAGLREAGGGGGGGGGGGDAGGCDAAAVFFRSSISATHSGVVGVSADPSFRSGRASRRLYTFPGRV